MILLQDKEKSDKYIKEIHTHHILDPSLKTYMKLAWYEEGEYIYRQNDPLDFLYIFVQGTIKVSYTSQNGKEVIFRILKQPRLMGEIEFLLDSPAACATQALSPVYCILLPLNKSRNFLLEDRIFLRYISKNLAEALSAANTAFSINQCYAPKPRLVSYILSIEKDGHFYFDYPIASRILDVSERHLFRLMGDLLKNKLIFKGKHGYQILNRKELISLSEARYIL